MILKTVTTIALVLLCLTVVFATGCPEDPSYYPAIPEGQEFFARLEIGTLFLIPGTDYPVWEKIIATADGFNACISDNPIAQARFEKEYRCVVLSSHGFGQ